MKKKEKAEKKTYLGLSDRAELEEEIKRNQLQNLRLGSSQMNIIGDKLILIQIVKLMAYIRYAIENKMKTEIKVKLGQKIASNEFNFDVNGLPIGELIAQPTIEIN